MERDGKLKIIQTAVMSLQNKGETNMLIGGKKVGKLKNIDMSELKNIINNLPQTLKYSYECVLNKDSVIENDKLYNLYIFRNDV